MNGGSGGKQFLEMIAYFVGWGLMIVCFGLYFAYFEKFQALTGFVKAMIPVIIVIGVAIILITRQKRKLRQRKEAGDYEDILRLPAATRLKIDLLMYAGVILILLLGYLIEKKVSGGDIIQAIMAYLVMLGIVKMIYK